MSQKSRSIFNALFLIFILIIGIGLGIFIVQTNIFQKYPAVRNVIRTIPAQCQNNSVCSLTNTSWQGLESNKKGFPVLNNLGDVTLKLYSINEKTLKDTEIKVAWGSSASMYGDNDPEVSPDLLYTAYIDQEAGTLWLLANETLKKEKITLQKVDYITGWTKDSKRIIYYVSEDDILSRKSGPGPAWEGKEQFTETKIPGFYSFDIESGKSKNLYPVSGVESIVGTNKLLIKSGFENEPNKLVLFNIDTFEADYSVQEEFGFGAGQFEFTEDGEYWTFTLSNNPTEDASIVYAPFPEKEGLQIDSGEWAEVQWPRFSPDGSKIAYLHSEGMIPPGHPNNFIWVYDTNTKEKKKFSRGNSVWWVNENTLVVRDYDNIEANTNRFYILDLKSGNTFQIYPEK